MMRTLSSFCCKTASSLLKGPNRTPNLTSRRFYPALPKRFYRKANVLCNEDNVYEITLDQRKLKTPSGSVFKINNEPLALAVAAEWDSQKDVINRSAMHLTALCNTVIDNPCHLTKEELVPKLLSFLDTDAIIYHSEEENELHKRQVEQWEPIIDWFNQRYNVNIQPIRDISCTSVDDEIKQSLGRHLSSYSFPCLQGIAFAVESLKSLILTLCCIDRKISVETAVQLSRLEEEFQTERWGRVEWSHDLNMVDLQSRVAAAIMFVHLHLESSKTKSK
ncbi:ATP synthase mitochondrial F1 complex assembly factor 2 [Planococcus citri]|uniref:ATP synthase mitochondrial F1 complex assembly factor 2 n=1 Tax=Planococcus citri TaxID=170843 RepID=UPI0031FA2A39